MKSCAKCEELKDSSLFAPNKTKKDGLDYWCRACRSEYNKSYKRKEQPYDPVKSVSYRLRFLYRLTIEQFEQMLLDQDNKCAICRTEFTTRRSIHVDHDHECCKVSPQNKRTCGKCVRGLLCSTCNQAVGRFESTRTNFLAYLDRKSI